MKSKYRNIFLMFGIAAIVVMLCSFDMEYDELLANLRRAGMWLPAVVGLWIIIYLFNTLSWYIIIRDGKKGTPIPFWKVYKLTVSGFALNYATPVGLMGGEPHSECRFLKFSCRGRKEHSHNHRQHCPLPRKPFLPL